jgi:hypothetical protein
VADQSSGFRAATLHDAKTLVLGTADCGVEQAADLLLRVRRAASRFLKRDRARLRKKATATRLLKKKALWPESTIGCPDCGHSFKAKINPARKSNIRGVRKSPKCQKPIYSF